MIDALSPRASVLYPIAYLNDPEFAWRKNDPRMKALAARQVGRQSRQLGTTEAR